jgi:hypothetical protein
MRQSMKSIVLKTAYELAEEKSNEAVAFSAVKLEQEFREFVFAYIERIKELSRKGLEPDANSATLCVLEWIEEYLGLNDADMNVIVPLFNNLAGDVARIEEIAKQVNWAASQKRRGFFSRLFGS